MARLIVEDVGPQRTNEIASGFARQVQQEENGWASEDELVASLMRRGTVAEELQRNYAHFGSKKRDDGRIVWKRDPNLVKGFVVTDLLQFVSKITCPTIYILGGASTIVPADTQRELKETLPKVEITTMPKLGHYPHQEAPEDYLKIVQGFLDTSK
jgi:pimeloyl-ACP methyl ester carboxylesterase